MSTDERRSGSNPKHSPAAGVYDGCSEIHSKGMARDQLVLPRARVLGPNVGPLELERRKTHKIYRAMPLPTCSGVRVRVEL
jgi:hypothetical protein